MTEFFTLFLAGISVGLGNFAASIAIGLSGVDKSTRIRIALVFGLFETVMPIIGLVIGRQIADKLGGYANLIGGALLILTGLYIVWGALKKVDTAEVKKASTNMGSLLIAGLALSIDNLIVGFSLGANKQSLWEAAAIIGITSVVMALIGLEIGSRLSSKVEEYSEVLSGIILILIGLAVGTKLI